MKNELGFWKGNRVIAVYKEDYVESDDGVVVWDDGRKVVYNGMEIGVLNNSGYITEVEHKRYKPQKEKKAKPQKKEKVEELVKVDEGDFYKQSSKVVDEFFASLSVGEKDYVVLGERKQLW